MIKSFADKVTEQFYITGKSKKLPADIQKTALRKLSYLNSAVDVNNLKVPPGKRLEALKEDYENKNTKTQVPGDTYNYQEANAL